MVNDHWQNEILDREAEREQEQLRKLDKFRKLALTMMGRHVWLILIVFMLILGALLVFVGLRGTYSPTRYLARLTLCFHPKHQSKIGQYDDKYVMRILNRRITREKFATQGGSNSPERKAISQNILISMGRKKSNTFSIELYAGSEDEAVKSINEFAQICIEQYCEERTKDLQQWKSHLEVEKEGLYQDIQKFDSKISDLILPLQMTSPEKDQERLRRRLNELHNTRTRVNFVLENLQLRKKQLEEELTGVNPELLSHQKELKEFFQAQESLDREIALATELYTDENPKMIALNSRRSALQKRLELFMKEKKIESADPRSLRLAETLSSDLKTLQIELESKQNEVKVLDGEAKDCEEKLRKFREAQPRLQWLNQQRKNLQESMQRLDESISEINYMQMMVKEDLFVNEQAKSAVGNNPFSKKNLAICLFAALALTAFCAALVSLFEFFFGTVADAKELNLYSEFRFLGVLPSSEELLRSAGNEQMIMNTIFHNLQTAGPKVIFTGALSGARIIPQFFDFLKWNFGMEGKQLLIIDMVLSSDFDGEEDSGEEADNTMIVTFSGGKCYLPLSSKKFLMPAEQELLKNDINYLKERYDCIFLRHSFPLRRSRLLLEQIAPICDAALYAIGSGKTPRKNLRELLAVQLKVKIPILTILVDHVAANLNKDLKLETES